jgi:hypothetical protein
VAVAALVLAIQAAALIKEQAGLVVVALVEIPTMQPQARQTPAEVAVV